MRWIRYDNYWVKTCDDKIHIKKQNRYWMAYGGRLGKGMRWGRSFTELTKKLASEEKQINKESK